MIFIIAATNTAATSSVIGMANQMLSAPAKISGRYRCGKCQAFSAPIPVFSRQSLKIPPIPVSRYWGYSSVSGPDFLCRMFRVSVYAFLAMSHRAVKATASLMAISESILRLIWMPATFRPCIKVE